MIPKNQKIVLTVLAMSVLVFPAFRAEAQIGPEAPMQQKPKTDAPVKDRLKDSFKKMFTPQEEEDSATPADDIRSGTGQAAPEADERPQPPKRPPMLKQDTLASPKVEAPEVDPDNPPAERIKIDDPNNPLGLADATNRMKEIIALIEEERYVEAQVRLTPLRQWLVDSTEAHINLYKTLNNIPSARAQAELEKQLGLEFALLRDRAMFELARIQIAQNDHRKAVKELTDVVRSQPKSQIGIRAYELLQDIGFTEKLHLGAQ